MRSIFKIKKLVNSRGNTFTVEEFEIMGETPMKYDIIIDKRSGDRRLIKKSSIGSISNNSVDSFEICWFCWCVAEDVEALSLQISMRAVQSMIDITAMHKKLCDSFNSDVKRTIITLNKESV